MLNTVKFERPNLDLSALRGQGMQTEEFHAPRYGDLSTCRPLKSNISWLVPNDIARPGATIIDGTTDYLRVFVDLGLRTTYGCHYSGIAKKTQNSRL